MKPSLFFLLLATIFSAFPNDSQAARYIRASIIMDGKTVMKGSWSDNGKVDADGVWQYLKQIEFTSTEDFNVLGIDTKTTKSIHLGSKDKDELPNIKIKIAYGGEVTLKTLKLTSYYDQKNKKSWRLDSKEVDGTFNERLISRRLASRLRHPVRLFKE